MNKNDSPSFRLAALRRQARQKMKQRLTNLSELSAQDMTRLVHELGTQQIELEMQNEELRIAQENLSASEEKYRNLFDFAPVGYFTLDEKGIVLDVNAVGADLMGSTKAGVVMKPFQNFIADQEDMRVFRSCLDACYTSGTCQTCEIRLRKPDGAVFHARLASIVKMDNGKEQKTCQLAISDINESKLTEQTLRASENKYRDLFDSTLDGIFQVNAEGFFLLMNSAGARIFGYDNPDEILGKNVLEFWRDPKDRDVYRKELKIRKRLSAYSMKAKKKNGEPLELESSTRIIEDEKGNLLGIEGILRDVTARKRADDECRAAVQRWNNTFDAINDAVSILDKDGKILQCNQAMLYMLEKLPGDIIGNPCWEVVYHETGPTQDCPFDRMRKSLHREFTSVRLLGRWFNVTLDPILDQTGNLAGCVHIMSDITEHKQFEEQLKESESKFRSLSEQSLVGPYIIRNDRFKYVNRRLADIFGYREEDLIERVPPLDLVVPEDRHTVDNNIRGRVASGSSVLHYDFQGLKKNGDIIHVEVYGSRALYQGSPAIIGVLLDISEKKKLESQLLQSQKMEAIGQLTGGIAHDFNNILSAIIGYASLMQMKMGDDQPFRPYVDQILAGTDRAANLTRSLLTFSRKQVSNPMPVDVNGIIGRVDKLLHRIIGEDVDLRLALAPRDLVVNADAGQIEQVLMNLATNARDAMPRGGILSIESAVVDSEDILEQRKDFGGKRYALISVTDTGAGMDEKTKEKIFEPFFTTKGLGRGTGLGLSMVYGIITQHNGHIHCYSEPGKGTTFKVYLPLLTSGVKDRPRAATTSSSEAPPRGSETVLIAEDDAVLRNLAKMTLEDFGYTVIEAVDGEDAIKKFRENKDRVSLVLCDVIMPKISGGEVREEIMKLSHDARIIFMSGYPADIVHQKGILAEDAELVLKPIPPTVLIRKVREALDKK